jgi:elongation factor G
LDKVSLEKIRNIALIGHGGCGKTSLGEALLYKSGVTTRLGSVDQGNSLFDSDPEEIKRKISINLAVAHLTWKDTWFNIVDTPGYLDFAGEVSAALRVVDNALVVINAPSGIEVGTEKYWEVAEERKLPRIIFVNRMKSPEVDYESILSELKETFGAKVTPVQLPVGRGEKFKGVFDLLKGDLSSLPDELKDTASSMRDSLRESIIELSEELLDRYLGGEEIEDTELQKTLKEGIIKGDFIPVLFGEALEVIGIEELLDFISLFGASPAEGPKEIAKLNEEEVEIKGDPAEPLASFVFKTLTEPHLGELYFIRVFSGTISPGKDVINSNLGRTEKINQIFLVRGKERKETNLLQAGMIGVLVKLKETKTGHTLASKEKPFILSGIPFPEPNISIAIVPKTREDEEKVSEGLSRLHDEDPTFTFHYDTELKQTLISGIGELHLDVIVSKLREKFSVNVDTERPKIPYRETIRKPAQAMGKYVKQTGGRGQYGICYIKIEPLKRGEGYEFVNSIFGGAIPSSFIPSVETGIKKAMERGVLAGYPVVDVKVTLYDGKYHPVDSSNIAFEIAGSLAFKDAESQADPYLLEPIYLVEVSVPKEYMGDVIGDLNARRGKILGIEAEGKMQRIKALVPLAELYKYSTTLRSITKGRGNFTMSFSHYDEVPREISKKIIEEAKREQEEEK